MHDERASDLPPKTGEEQPAAISTHLGHTQTHVKSTSVHFIAHSTQKYKQKLKLNMKTLRKAKSRRLARETKTAGKHFVFAYSFIQAQVISLKWRY